MTLSGTAKERAEVYLVAIGASAGGLEPLEGFFEEVGDEPGIAYVIVQHLSPDYRSMMNELLGRRSSLSMRRIEDGMPIEPNTVYLNQPNEFVVIEDEVFRTYAYQETDGLPHLPIDRFFSSLMNRDLTKTVAVIMSGSGSDGAIGAQALHDAGAAILVQSTKEAAFPSMPRAVLMTGAVDRVLDAKQMPAVAKELLESGGATRPSLGDGGGGGQDLKRILALLETRHGVDFASYKSTNVGRRIRRRMHLRGHSDLQEYLEVLSQSEDVIDELYEDMLIGVTEFYRDPEAIKSLRKKVLDELASDTSEKAPIKVWVPACASGEEVYTIGIELSEALREAKSDRRFRIIGTDLHAGSIETASRGVYSADKLENVPKDLLERYFQPFMDGYVVDPALRQKVIFSTHNLISDPPFMNLDLVSCRNLLIYLEEEPQATAISMFLFGLLNEGFLYLGASETVGKFKSAFDVIDARWRIFRKVMPHQRMPDIPMSRRIVSPQQRQEISRLRWSEERKGLGAQTNSARSREMLMRSYHALLNEYAPDSILMNSDFKVLNWFGRASWFIDTMNNLAEWTVQEIVNPDLHFAINVGVEKLRIGHQALDPRRVTVSRRDGPTHSVLVNVEALSTSSEENLILVTLEPETNEAAEQNAAVQTSPQDSVAADDITVLTKRSQTLERDLRLTEETLQHVTERLEASGEELQASNEELQASNEELQASNEELQASNEELHAVNEELVSVSAAHERKIDELSELHETTELVLQLMNTGIMILDENDQIRRFSSIVESEFLLKEHDIGRSVATVGPRLSFVELSDMLAELKETQTTQTAEGEQDGKHLSVETRLTLTGPAGNRETSALLIFRWGA